MEQWNRNTAWRQGSVLPKEACAALNLQYGNGDAQIVAVVVSHDCDLAQDPLQEPEVELMLGRVIDKPDGNCTHAKNPRKLHLEFDGESAFIGEFVATAKCSVKKDLLLPCFSPDPACHLRPENHNALQFWLASRYRRSAFPDEFDRRLTSETGLSQKIAKIIKQHGVHLSGIFFDVDEGQEVKRDGEDDTYSLRIFLLHPSDPVLGEADPGYQASEKAALQASHEITKLFTEKLFKPKGQWQHIELDNCFVLSEEMLTYQQFKQLKRWRFEHISLASNPQQEVLPE